MYCGHARLCVCVCLSMCLSVCLSAAAYLQYCTDPGVSWGSGSGCRLVVRYWADLQSVHGLRCYGNIMRTPNVSEYMLLLILCLVWFCEHPTVHFCLMMIVVFWRWRKEHAVTSVSTTGRGLHCSVWVAGRGWVWLNSNWSMWFVRQMHKNQDHWTTRWRHVVVTVFACESCMLWRRLVNTGEVRSTVGSLRAPKVEMEAQQGIWRGVGVAIKRSQIRLPVRVQL